MNTSVMNRGSRPRTVITLVTEIDVHRPAERVWALLADYGRDPEWRAGVATMAPSPPGPVRAGTTTDERIRVAGREYRNGGLVTAVDPGRGFAWRTTSGVDADGERRVEERGPDRCRVRLVQHVRPTGAQRLAAPLLRVLLARTLRADAARLRGLAER